ncbi:MAG: shikimate kinase [Gemmatimonadaceae bacterium]|nr:shikimate kinase [Gemmatimonadaceae bacterium]
MTGGEAESEADAGAALVRPAHLVLVGLPGAGKTTHGRHAARHMQRPFIDLDKRVAHLAGRSVPEIFRLEGEAAFRSRERLATAALSLEPASIVAPGGGWVLDPANVALVKPAATIIWLKVSPRVAVRRMGGRVGLRPLLAEGDPVARLEALLRQREARYATADAVIDTEVLDWQGVVSEIAALATPATGR